MLKKAVSKLVPAKYKKMFRNWKILAKDYGQYRTIEQWNCIDRYNNMIPWYTYPAIEFLNNLDFSSMKVFEYGSGNSSFFWSARAKEVTSIEHDADWHARYTGQIEANQTILLVGNDEKYEQSIAQQASSFDVIVIDGIRRAQCAKVIAPFISNNTNGAMIILDNADWYKETAKFLRETLDLIEIDFHGFGPINDYTWTTSIFLTRNYNFKPIHATQPHFSVAAVKQSAETSYTR
jgi:hypothetical protein